MEVVEREVEVSLGLSESLSPLQEALLIFLLPSPLDNSRAIFIFFSYEYDPLFFFYVGDVIFFYVGD